MIDNNISICMYCNVVRLFQSVAPKTNNSALKLFKSGKYHT